MGGTLRLAIDGGVAINDVAGDMTVGVIPDGFAPEAFGPEVVLDDFRGPAVVRGSHFTVEAERSMRVLAHGRGFAAVKTRDSCVRLWDEDQRLHLAA